MADLGSGKALLRQTPGPRRVPERWRASSGRGIAHGEARRAERTERAFGLAGLDMAREAGAVSASAQFSLRLAKEDFAFAAAHFTLFPDAPAERLHGHNYRVRAVLGGPALDREGMLVAVAPVKAAIRALCAALDERVLIAEKSPKLELKRDGDGLCVRLGARDYRFPIDEVTLLPLPNVTIEALAQHLWQGLAPSLAKTPVTWLRLEVEETAGQSARYESPLP